METSIAAPAGANWVEETVKRGDVHLPALILVFDDYVAMTQHFTPQGLLNMADGTSFRVYQQQLWRTRNDASVDEICAQIVGYRPGRKSTGALTAAQKRIAELEARLAELEANN